MNGRHIAASTLEPDAVVREFDTPADNGLSNDEASRRLRSSGRNELRAAEPPSRWMLVLAQFRDPLVYLLLGAVAISFGTWLIEGCR